MEKLNLQLFAEDGNDEGSGNASANQSQGQIDIDYDKLADTISKRTQASTNTIVKGILEKQGLTGDQLNEAVKAYKEKVEQDRLDKENAQKAIKDENLALKQQINDFKVNDKLL